MNKLKSPHDINIGSVVTLIAFLKLRLQHEPRNSELHNRFIAAKNLLETLQQAKKRDIKTNPIQNHCKIYGKILAIEAVKGSGKDSLWPNQKFRHDFKSSSKAEIIGLEDGSILIKSKNGTNLWKMFDGYEKGIDY